MSAPRAWLSTVTTPAAGYDPMFLGLPVPLPLPAAAIPAVTLPFTHFTVVLQPARRLAVVTGVNVDGAALVDLDRGDDWHLDPRVPADQQTGPEVYERNDLDRGHLVRRRDPVWGDPQIAARANIDTFTYVNAAPQAAPFNQGPTLWAGLEDYVLGHARTYAQRLSVFTAPVLVADDPTYRGAQIPRLFWKIAAWGTTTAQHADTVDAPETLAATGYLLDQSAQLDAIDLQARAAAVDPPPLGAYLTYQVPITDIATLTGLDLGPLPAADRAPAPAAGGRLDPRAAPASGRWRPLTSYDDIRL